METNAPTPGEIIFLRNPFYKPPGAISSKGPHVFSVGGGRTSYVLTKSKAGNRKPSSSYVVHMHPSLIVVFDHVQREQLP